jgi:Tol biopolymer transport system component
MIRVAMTILRQSAIGVGVLLAVQVGHSLAADGPAAAPSPTTVPVLASQPAEPPNPSAEAAMLADITQLTTGFARAGEAYFSPDQKWIVFQASEKADDPYQMYVAPFKEEANPIGGIGKPIRVSPDQSRNTCGYFSPDGHSLIFASTAGKDDPNEQASGYQRGTGTYRWSFPKGMEIYKSDGWLTAVTSPAVTATGRMNLANHALTNNDAYDAECAFSPDGRFICFTSNRGGGDLDIWTMHADGSHPVQLTHTPGYDGGPFFSPDGKRLVYRSDRQGNNLLQIFVSDIVFDDHGEITGLANERQLTTGATVNWGPFWHPDGHHIIYATSIHGPANYELYVMRDDGTHATRVTYWPGADILPAFSVDGKYLMWTSKRAADHTTQIFVAKFKLADGV